MPKIKVTKQDIVQTAEAIAAQGIVPTQHNVRAQLGQGSKSTIHKYLKLWKQECFQNTNRVGKTLSLIILSK